MLAGCANPKVLQFANYQAADKAVHELTHPPGNIDKPCPDPGVRSGSPAIVELARNRRWGKCTAGRHRLYVGHVQGAAARLGAAK